VNDIINEIKHEMAEERYQRIFVEHGKKLILIAAAIIIGVAAKSIYTGMQKSKGEEAGKLFVEAFSDSSPENYDAIIEGGQKGFAPLAILMKSGLQNVQEDGAGALETLKEIEGTSYDKAFIHKAKLDKAFLLIENKGDKKEIISLLDEVSAKTAPFYATAAELKAIYLLEQGDKKQAVQILRELAIDNYLPSTITDRAKQMLSIINE